MKTKIIILIFFKLIIFKQVSCSNNGNTVHIDTNSVIFKAKMMVLATKAATSYSSISSKNLFTEITKLQSNILEQKGLKNILFISIQIRDTLLTKHAVFEHLKTGQHLIFNDSLYHTLFVNKYKNDNYNNLEYLDSILDKKSTIITQSDFMENYLLVYDIRKSTYYKIWGFSENYFKYLFFHTLFNNQKEYFEDNIVHGKMKYSKTLFKRIKIKNLELKEIYNHLNGGTNKRFGKFLKVYIDYNQVDKWIIRND